MRRAVLTILILLPLVFTCTEQSPDVITLDISRFFDANDNAGWLAFIETRHYDARNKTVAMLRDYLAAKAGGDAEEMSDLQRKLDWSILLYDKTQDIHDLSRRYDLYRSLDSAAAYHKTKLDSLLNATLSQNRKGVLSLDSLDFLLPEFRLKYESVPDSFYLAFIDYQIGAILYKKQEIDSAESYFNRSREICCEIDDLGQMAQCELQIARIYSMYRADYCRSEIAYQKAIRLYRRIDYQSGIHHAYLGRGRDFLQLFENNEAIRQFNLAMDGFIKRNKYRETAFCRHFLAESYYNKGVFDTALIFVDQALDDRKEIAKKFKQYRSDIGHSESTAGLIYQALGKRDKALKKYKEAEQTFEKTKLKTGQCLNSLRLASLYLEEKKYSEAKQLFRQALRLNDKSEKYEELLFSIYGLAICLSFENEHDMAIRNLRQCIRLVEDSRRKLPVPDLKAGMLADKIGFYNLLINIFINQYKNNGQTDYVDSALYYIEKSKAVTFKEMLTSDGKETGSPKEDSLLQSISRIYREVALGDMAYDGAEKQIEQLEDSLRHLRVDLAAETVAEDIEPDELIGIGDIRRDITENDDVLLEYVISGHGSFVLTIDDTLFKIAEIKMEYDSLAMLIAELVQSISSPPTAADSTNDFRKNASRLYRELLPDDILSRFPARHLIIAASGPLHYLPFGVLIDKNDCYLAENYEISYAPSVSSLQMIKRQNGAADDAVDILALGDPSFRHNDIGITDDNDITVERDFQMFSYENIPALPYSRIEIDSIKSIFGAESTTSFLDNSASESNFKSSDFSRIRYIHLASHGVSDIHNPNRSAILLSCLDDPNNDGLLHPDEIRQLDYTADLIFLSACRTGVGRLLPGEGVMNLARPFLVSGCRAAVVTCWNINDKSTAKLVSDFYKNIKAGNSIARSLARAKREFINSEREMYRHPYFWAPYIVIGLDN